MEGVKFFVVVLPSIPARPGRGAALLSVVVRSTRFFLPKARCWGYGSGFLIHAILLGRSAWGSDLRAPLQLSLLLGVGVCSIGSSDWAEGARSGRFLGEVAVGVMVEVVVEVGEVAGQSGGS